jgi:NodT family efflux transporter outer membrane factor (OMF) lipoprotein
MRIRALAAVACASLLASCTVGPKYSKPLTPAPPTFKEAPPESFKESGGWKAASPSDQAIRGKWWELFGDSTLNDLEDQMTAANLNLKIAEASFREARAMIKFNRAAQFPTITAGGDISTLHYSANRPFTTAGGHSAGDFVLPLDLSYELDLWGRVRRTVAASKEEAQATAADLESVRLSLHAELAFDYFELRAADAQKQLLDDTVKAYTDALKLTTNRYEGGAAPPSDVAQARTQLATTQAQDTDIGVQRAEFEHAIAVLIGKAPAEFRLAPAPLDLQPPVIPVGLPSQLLERRPDVAGSERRVAEANEQIGIARAAFFPTVALGASAGFEGSSILNWLTWPSRFWAVGPSMLQTVFDAGRRRAASDAALAAYDASVASYRESTLIAFQQVEDNLAALRILEREAQQQREAVEAAQETLRIFTNRYRGGIDSYLQVITAQTATLTNQRTDVDIRRRRMQASILLIKALGGGWDRTQLPTF